MRLIDADKLYPDRMTDKGLAISQSQISDAPTALDYDWIVRTIPDFEIDFNKIEKALGFKLFIWQKTYIAQGKFRQYGETTAKCIKRLLQKNEPIDFERPPTSAKEHFERMEMLEIRDKLLAAGIQVCEIRMPRRLL